MTRKKRRILIGGLVVLGLLAAWLIPPRLPAWNDNLPPVEQWYTVSPETTVISGPRRPDGTMDYAGYLDRKYSEGVTRENNAAVLLAEALGPQVFAEHMRPYLRDKWGVWQDPNAPYFMDEINYWKSCDSAEDREPESDSEELSDRVYEVMYRPWTAEEYPLVADWLEANRRPLELLARASRRPEFFVPLQNPAEPSDMISAYPMDLGEARSLAKAVLVKAMRHVGDGDYAAASEDLLTVYRFNRLFGRSPLLLQQLVSRGIESKAYIAGRRLVAIEDLSRAVLQSHLECLAGREPVHDHMKSVAECERLNGLDCAMAFMRDDETPIGTPDTWGEDPTSKPKAGPLLIDYDLMLRRVNEAYDLCDRVLLAKSPQELDIAVKRVAGHTLELSDRIGGWRPLLLRIRQIFRTRSQRRRAVSQLLSDHLLSIILPCLDRAVLLHHQARMQKAVLRAGLALRLYQLDHGELPETLSALTSEYIDTIPKDWFSQEKLVYRRSDDGKGFLVYSVGWNGSDDDGFGWSGGQVGRLVPEDEKSDADDIAVWYRYGEEDGG